MFNRIDVDGFFRAPVIFEIRLAVAVQVCEAQSDRIGNRKLKEPGCPRLIHWMRRVSLPKGLRHANLHG